MNQQPPSSLAAPYTIFSPPREAMSVPVIFSIPHSGTSYPDDFGYTCPMDELRRAEDTLVDDLFSGCVQHGAYLIRANVPRTYIDLNRNESDIDPDMLSENWPYPPPADYRSPAGHGLIRRALRPGVPIYGRKISVTEIANRLHQVFHPYHSALTNLIADLHTRFEYVYVIDCHSMPSSAATTSGGGPVLQLITGSPVDIVLGDMDGRSFPLPLRRRLQDQFRELGYRVSINNPYKGAEILRRYGRPDHGTYALQIELSKALYLNETTYKKSSNYNRLKSELNSICQLICAAATPS